MDVPHCIDIFRAISLSCSSCVEFFANNIQKWDAYFSTNCENILHFIISYSKNLSIILSIILNAILNTNFDIKKHIDDKDFLDRTPLILISRNINHDTDCCLSIEILLKNGASPNIDTHIDRNNPLFLASAYKCARCIKTLVLNGALVNIENYYRETPLKLAIISNCLESVKILVENGASVDGTLLNAVSKKNLEIIKCLVKNGAKSLDLNDVIHFIVGKGCPQIAQYLIENAEKIGVNLENKTYNHNETILHVICKNKDDYMLDCLPVDVIYKNINKKDLNGRTPLFLAVKFSNKKSPTLNFTKKILELGALTEIKDAYGKKAINYIERDTNYLTLEEYIEIKILLRDWQELPPF